MLKVNTAKKPLCLIKACENWSGQLKCSGKKSCSYIPRENMRGGDHLYPGVQLAVWNVTKEKLHKIYFPVTYLRLLITSILPIGQLRSSAP